jgi:hypothetical protein
MTERDTEAGKQKWITETMDRRRQAQDLLNECSDPRINKFQTVEVPEVVRALHSAILTYRGNIRPKAKALAKKGLWDVDLNQELNHPVTVPQDKYRTDGDGNVVGREGYLIGETDMYGEVDAGSVLEVADMEVWPINPKTLEKFWRANNQVTLTGKVKDGDEIVKDQSVYSVYLPVAASTVLKSHFDKCLEELGWLPDTDDSEDAETKAKYIKMAPWAGNGSTDASWDWNGSTEDE